MNLYKCLACQKKFETPQEVDNCIYCGSDNITPVKSISPIWLMLLVFLLCVPVGYLVTELMTSLGDEDEIIVIPDDDRKIVPPIDSTTIPVIVSVSEPQYKNGSFTFSVTADVKRGRLMYTLTAPGSLTPDYTSDDGKFSGIAPTEDGIYTLKVENVTSNQSDSKVLVGFVKPVQQPVKKLTKSDIQKILDTQTTPQGLSSKFAKGYKLKFVGLDQDEPQPDRFDEIINRLVATWSKAEVVDVKYDELNRITSLTIKVIY